MKLRNLYLTFCFLLLSLCLSSEVIWDNFYNPFGATGINVRPHMAVCADGGFALTGYYIIEDPEGGYIDWCGFVMKISSEGELLWADKDTLSFATAPTHESKCIIETNDGGLINAGDGYMIKRDSNGNRLWTQDLDIAPTTMCHSHDGYIVLSGSGPNGSCLFRIIDEDGNELLNNDFICGSNYTVAKRIIPTSDLGYAITGVVSDEIANTDLFICKTDAVGDTLWTYRKDGSGNSDSGNWIIENSEQDLFVCGELFYDNRDYISGYGALISLTGDIIWERDTPNEMTGLQQFYSLDIPEDNSIMIWAGISGVYKCDYNYNIEWIDNNNELLPYFQMIQSGFIFYIGGIDGVHLRKTDYNIVSSDDNVISINHQILKCYPNPFNPEITISFNLFNHIENTHINIYNSKGQRVKQYEASQYDSSIIWNGNDENERRVSSGVYFVTINSKSKTLAFKKITMIK